MESEWKKNGSIASKNEEGYDESQYAKEASACSERELFIVDIT